MRLSELIGLPVETDTGKALGHVHDVRAEQTQNTLRLTSLVVGGIGLLERLGIAAPGSGRRPRRADAIPWTAVVRADARGVVVRDDAR
jgi:sporulation protein YlmC with PRC-barrel domain